MMSEAYRKIHCYHNRAKYHMSKLIPEHHRPIVQYSYYCGPEIVEPEPPVIIHPEIPLIPTTDPCDTSLSRNTIFAKTFPYITTPPSLIVDDWKYFFTNSDEAHCPITSCSIKASGCSSPYLSTHLSITGTPPT